jgi:hypothetical protein
MFKENIRSQSLALLLLNTSLAIIVLFILINALSNLGLVTYTTQGIIATSLGFFAVAFFNLLIRVAEASRLGYQYYYEHSLAYAMLSFIVNARFYGFFPVLYLGGSKISVDKVGRIGSGDIGPNHEDLYNIAVLPIQGNLLICLAILPAILTTTNSFLTVTGFLIASYTLFSMIPWPYSNGLHILSFNYRVWSTLTLASAVFVGLYAVL